MAPPNFDSRDVVLSMILEFSQRIGSNDMYNAAASALAGREPYISQYRRAASIMVAKTIMSNIPISNEAPELEDLITGVKRISAMADIWGPISHADSVLQHLGTQIAIESLKDGVLSTSEAIEAFVNLVPEEIQNAVMRVRDKVAMSADPISMLEKVSLRSPYKAAALYIHEWLRSMVTMGDEPCRLEEIFSILVGDLSKSEPGDLSTFYRTDPKDYISQLETHHPPHLRPSKRRKSKDLLPISSGSNPIPKKLSKIRPTSSPKATRTPSPEAPRQVVAGRMQVERSLSNHSPVLVSNASSPKSAPMSASKTMLSIAANSKRSPKTISTISASSPAQELLSKAASSSRVVPGSVSKVTSVSFSKTTAAGVPKTTPSSKSKTILKPVSQSPPAPLVSLTKRASTPVSQTTPSPISKIGSSPLPKSTPASVSIATPSPLPKTVFETAATSRSKITSSPRPRNTTIATSRIAAPVSTNIPASTADAASPIVVSPSTSSYPKTPSSSARCLRFPGGADAATMPTSASSSEFARPLTLVELRALYPGTNKQFRSIWKQTHPNVMRYLRERRM
uniref:Uncharacterized protein n=1 Tax=Spongospora subterranea TaxID=70186 RepID=A0A0H5R674_9EUKA|eukprot:CRZ09336.1 hypothetical protein [Spongospora subterranea]